MISIQIVDWYRKLQTKHFKVSVASIMISTASGRYDVLKDGHFQVPVPVSGTTMFSFSKLSINSVFTKRQVKYVTKSSIQVGRRITKFKGEIIRVR